MTTEREPPDGTTITYASDGRLWERPDGNLLSVNYGPWEPVEILIDFGDQTCPACQLEHPGTDCQQPDLFGREVDAGGGVCWRAQIGRPRSAGNTAEAWPSYLNRHNREDFRVMTHPSGTRHTKTTVHKDGDRWQVTFPCDCPALSFRRHEVALTFATHHTCPPPWAPIPARRKRLTRTVR